MNHRYALILTFIMIILVQGNMMGKMNISLPEAMNGEPVIQWDFQRKLIWSDFRAKHKPPGKVPAALSTCGFGFEATEENRKLVSVAVHVTFYQDKSWKNPEHQTESVLAHEQLHFDITELMGRKFHQEIIALHSKGKLSRRTLEKAYDRMSKEHSELQELYDKQTNHSLNAKMQVWWSDYIASQILKTSPYSGYQFIHVE
jgi:hypothetical protein